MASLDEAILRALNVAGSNSVMDAVMIAISVMGTTYALAAISVVIWFKGRHELAFDSLVLLAIASFVVYLLKLVIQRDRPFETLDDVNFASIDFLSSATDNSMPSGHATKTFAIAVLVLLNGWKRAGYALLVLAVGVSLSRIYLGLHWPSDVLVGAMLGTALAFGFYQLTRRAKWYTKSRASVVGWITERSSRRGVGSAGAGGNARSIHRGTDLEYAADGPGVLGGPSPGIAGGSR